MAILDLVLERLNAPENTPEIALSITVVGDYIKEYCAFEEIPTAVFPLWADMVASFFCKEEDMKEDSLFGVSSVSMGDVSYTFSKDQHGAWYRIDEMLTDYRHRLDKVRGGLFR